MKVSMRELKAVEITVKGRQYSYVRLGHSKWVQMWTDGTLRVVPGYQAERAEHNYQMLLEENGYENT